MIMQMENVSMHAGNISNAQTAGFKRREMSSIPFKELVVNIFTNNSEKPLKLPIGTGSGAGYMMVDKTQGSLKPTGNVLDLGISGNAYFTVRKPNEAEVTTRNGRFILNSEGYMTTADGYYLVDDTGKAIQIQLPKGSANSGDTVAKPIDSRIVVKENGVMYDDGKEIAKLKIQTDSNVVDYIAQLKLAVPVTQLAARDPNTLNLRDKDNNEIRIKQGFLEGSNIQIISEMVGLIMASKSYESGHKLIMAEDKILDKAINELGRTG